MREVIDKDVTTWWPKDSAEMNLMLKYCGEGVSLKLVLMQDTRKLAEPGGGAYFKVVRKKEESKDGVVL
jgi:hypothetical protein